jgi:hypothetical protein
MMPQPNRFYITTRRPSRHDPGNVETGWYTFANGIVTLTDSSGEPLPGGWSRELKAGDDPCTIAKLMLREQRGKRFNFEGPLPLPPMGPLV